MIRDHSDPWRYRCPEGHTSWRSVNSGGFQCLTCGVNHDHLIDAKKEVPVQ